MRVEKRHIIAVAIILLEVLGIVWVFPYLPMADLPEHMLAAKILTHYNDAETNYAAFFTKKIPWNPYSSYFLFVVASEPALGVRTATRVYLSLAFVLTILAFWYWVRTVAPGRDAQVVPATLLLFGGFFYIGLLNFLFSAPFLFLALAAGWRVLEGKRHQGMNRVLLAVSLLVAYLSHAVTFGLAGLMLFLQAVLFFKGRRISRLVLPVMPSLLLLGVYLLTEARHDVSTVTLSYYPLSTQLATLLLPLDVFTDPITGNWTYDTVLLILWSLVLVVCAISRLSVGAVYDRAHSSKHAWLTFAIFTSSVLLLPSLLSEGQGLAFRGAYFAAFALVALLPTSWDHHAWSRLLMFLVCAAFPIVMATRMVGFTSEMKDLEAAISKMPPRQVVQPIITEPHSSPFNGMYSLQHAAAWYSFYKGGVSPYLIAAWAKHFPVHARMDFVPHPAGEWKMATFQYDAHQEGTDYFLVRTRDEKILADLTRHLPTAAASGSWIVFGPNR